MLDQWFSNGGDFAPKGHLAMSGDILDSKAGVPTSIQCVDNRDTANNPTMHRTASHSKEFSGPKYQ